MKLSAERRALRYFPLWLTVGWALVALIVYGSLTPSPPQIHVPEGDKIEHLGSYGVLMGWFMQLYSRPAHLRLALLCIALGVGMEYAQLASGYRDFEYMDMVADSAGVLLAWLLGGTALGRILYDLERSLLRDNA